MSRDKIFGLLIFIIIIALISYSIVKKKNLRQLPQRYVIGVVTKVGKSSSGGYYINYKYKIHGLTYENTMAFGYSDRVLRDDEFIVSVPEGHNNYGVLLLDCLVKNGSLVSPAEGWIKKPINCN